MSAQLYDPSTPYYEDYTPEEQKQADFIAESGRHPLGVAAAIGGAFLLYRTYMRRRLRQESTLGEPMSPGELMKRARTIYSFYLPKWLSMTLPAVMTGLHNGVRETDWLLGNDILYGYAEQYARGLGDHLNEVSAEAVTRGYRMLLNRQIPAKIALANVIDAFGLTNRGVSTLVGMVTQKENPRLSDVLMPSVKRMRMRRLIETGVNQRAELTGETESWTAKEQGKQIAWLYAVKEGKIPDTATRTWFTADDEKVCPYCGPLNGVTIPIEEKFSVGDGEVWSPPVHPNCRCTVSLVYRMVRKSENEWETQPRASDGRFGFRRHGILRSSGSNVAMAAAPAQKPPEHREEKKRDELPALSLDTPPALHLDVPPALSLGAPPALHLDTTPALHLRQAPALSLDQTPALSLAQETPALAVEEVAPALDVQEEAAPEVNQETWNLDAEKEEPTAEDLSDIDSYLSPAMDLYRLEKPVYGVLGGHEIYGTLDEEIDTDMTMAPSLADAKTVADEILNANLDDYIWERTHEQGQTDGNDLVWSEEGYLYYADIDRYALAAEWLIAKRAYELGVVTGDDSGSRFYDPRAKMFMDVKDTHTGQMDQVEVSIQEFANRTGLASDFEEMLPRIVKMNVVDTDRMSDAYYDSDSDSVAAFTTWGPHQVVGFSHDTSTDEDGNVIPYDVFEIEPIPDNNPYAE